MKNNFNARLALTKYIDTFIGNDGNPVRFEFCEVEFAPNLYCTFKLNSSNKRALEKYAPNLFQLLMNIPTGVPVIFQELEFESEATSELQNLYKEQENELQ